MFWAPFRGWVAWLRRTRNPDDPKRGPDQDVLEAAIEVVVGSTPRERRGEVRAYVEKAAGLTSLFELDVRIHWRYVFRGKDHDVARLLAAFQAFLDRNIDCVDSPDFPSHNYSPSVADD